MADLTPRISCKPDGIPAELRAWPQWVVWRLDPPRKEGSKPVKLLCNPKTGKPARTRNDPTKSYPDTAPDTWGTYEEAVRAYRTGKWAGIGFVFTEGDPFIGGDIDECRNPETGEMDPVAGAYVALAGTYTEISQSGTGVKFIGRAKKIGAECRRGNFELYDKERYFALTGCLLEGAPATIEDRQAEFAGIYRAWFPEKAKEAIRATSGYPQGAAASGGRPASPVSLADAELLERAGKAANGAAFEALWRGDTSRHGGNASSADLALCSNLAFWTNGDPARIDALFRQSGLYRDKWDEQRGAQTYGQKTIAKAMESFSSGYGDGRNADAAYLPEVPEIDLAEDEIPTENPVEKSHEKTPVLSSETGRQKVQINPAGGIYDEATGEVIEPPTEPDFETWKRRGRSLKNWKMDLDDRFRWAVGDWWNEIAIDHGEKMAFGRKLFGKTFKSVQNNAAVAKAWPIGQRRAAPFWLHAELVKQDAETRAKYFKRYADDKTLSREILRSELPSDNAPPTEKHGWAYLMQELPADLAKEIEAALRATVVPGSVHRAIRAALRQTLEHEEKKGETQFGGGEPADDASLIELARYNVARYGAHADAEEAAKQQPEPVDAADVTDECEFVEPDDDEPLPSPTPLCDTQYAAPNTVNVDLKSNVDFRSEISNDTPAQTPETPIISGPPPSCASPDRRQLAAQLYPDLVAATLARSIPDVPCDIPRSDGARWQTDNLRQTAVDVLSDFVTLDGFSEHEARSRLEWIAVAVRSRVRPVLQMVS